MGEGPPDSCTTPGWSASASRPRSRTASTCKIEETEKLDGYTRQRLSFHSEGDDRIAAYLLVPAGLKEGEKRPAVVVFHQTTRDTLKEPVGLGQKPELALALHLTRRGYVTLSPECYILKDPVGWAKGQAEALAKRRPGWTGMGKMTFDASRCVDFLETLPYVDSERIGCIGFSLGAKEVLYAMAFEPRYKAGVFNEGGIGLRMSNWTDAWYLTEKMKAHIPAMENHQVLALAAPRPFLILGGDSADGDASWTFIKAVLPVYDLLGAGDRDRPAQPQGQAHLPARGAAAGVSLARPLAAIQTSEPQRTQRAQRIARRRACAHDPIPAEDERIAHEVIGAAIEVHRLLGPGFLEKIYERALIHELMLRGISVQPQRDILVPYKEILISGQQLDLLAGERRHHRAQGNKRRPRSTRRSYCRISKPRVYVWGCSSTSTSACSRTASNASSAELQKRTTKDTKSTKKDRKDHQAHPPRIALLSTLYSCSSSLSFSLCSLCSLGSLPASGP